MPNCRDQISTCGKIRQKRKRWEGKKEWRKGKGGRTTEGILALKFIELSSLYKMYLEATYSFWTVSRGYFYLLLKECPHWNPNMLQSNSAPGSAGHLSWIGKLLFPRDMPDNCKMQLSVLAPEGYEGHILERHLCFQTAVQK